MRSPRSTNPTLAQAFTMVEVLIVVVILGITASLAVPMFQDSATTQLREAASLVAADLDAARIDSLSHADDPRIVVFEPVARRYYVAGASDPATPVDNPFDHLPYRVTFGKGRATVLGQVGIGSVTVVGDDNTVAFGVYGQLDQATPAVIELTADGNRVTLTLDPATGRSLDRSDPPLIHPTGWACPIRPI